eukprot:184604_1
MMDIVMDVVFIFVNFVSKQIIHYIGYEWVFCCCSGDEWCGICESSDYKPRFKCVDCGIEYKANEDDALKLCDGCGNNWVCLKCNSLEVWNENGNDCNQDDATYMEENQDNY